MLFRMASVGLVLAAALLPGCETGPRSYQVAGKITADGEPIELGEILFDPVPPGPPVHASRIEKGAYRLTVKEGSYIVRLNGVKLVQLPPGKTNAYGETSERQQFLPPKYNAQSELKIEIRSNVTKDFDLTSK
jgi:hypothetical protein